MICSFTFRSSRSYRGWCIEGYKHVAPHGAIHSYFLHRTHVKSDRSHPQPTISAFPPLPGPHPHLSRPLSPRPVPTRPSLVPLRQQLAPLVPRVISMKPPLVPTECYEALMESSPVLKDPRAAAKHAPHIPTSHEHRESHPPGTEIHPAPTNRGAFKPPSCFRKIPPPTSSKPAAKSPHFATSVSQRCQVLHASAAQPPRCCLRPLQAYLTDAR